MMLRRWAIAFMCRPDAGHTHDCRRQGIEATGGFWTERGAVKEAERRNGTLSVRGAQNYVWLAVRL